MLDWEEEPEEFNEKIIDEDITELKVDGISPKDFNAIINEELL